MTSNNTHYTIEYQLEQDDGTILSHSVEIDQDTQISRTSENAPLPEWTKLENGQCNHCSLSNTEYCPIAIRLFAPVQHFGALVSYTPVTATVVTPERNYVKKVDTQEALRSLFGLIMATSGCPSMQPFKFMARYHLPFSSLEETISRITSTYLLHQLFKYPGATSIPVHFEEIEQLYSTMRSLNEGMARRLRHATQTDGAVNAIAILSIFSSLIPVMIEKELARLKPLFN